MIIKKMILTIMRCFSLILFISIANINISYAEEFMWPLESGDLHINSPMYDRTGVSGASPGYHLGFDFAVPKGERIFAAAGGTVVMTSQVGSSGAGNMIVLKHQLEQDFIYDNVNYGNVIYTRYLHMSKFGSFKLGDTVAKGEVVGYVGTTGLNENSYGEHLHFDILSANTGGYGVVKKDVSATEGKGSSIYASKGSTKGKNVYTVLYSKTNPQNAAFSPELIIGKDLAIPQNSTTTPGGSTINPKEDIEKALEISSDVVEYGKLSGLGKTLGFLKASVKKYAKIISACLVFISTILIGIAIIFKSKNAEERIMLVSGFMAVGIGSLIVALASYLVDMVIEI